MDNLPVDLGIDIGSTTVKIVVMDREDRVVDTLYRYHHGNPFLVVKEYLDTSEWEVFRSWPPRRELRILSTRISGSTVRFVLSRGSDTSTGTFGT